MNKKYGAKSSIVVRKVSLISVLVAIGVIMSIIDKMISTVAFPFLPMAKIGLANIIIIFGVYRFSFSDCLLMVILKSVLVGLIFGSIMSFYIGFTGSLLSFLGMWSCSKLLKNNISQIGISVIGGFLHIIGQLIVIYFAYKLKEELILYGSLLIFVSLITSILVGYISLKTIGLLDYYIKK